MPVDLLANHPKRKREPRDLLEGPQEAWSAAAEADQIEQWQGTGSFLDMTGSGMAKAVPFADEIASGLNAPFRAAREWWEGEGFDLGRAYDRNMQVEEELQRRRQERSPVLSTVGAVAGGMGAAGPLVKGGATLLQGAQATLPSLMWRGAAEGAAYGAAYGAGEGRGLRERAVNAGVGGLSGGAIGGALGGIARIGAGPSTTAAQRNLQRAVADDALTPEMAAARLQELGPEATLADLGPNLQRQAGALAATPGRGQEIIRGGIAQRQAGSGQRISSTLDDVLGQPVDTIALADDIISRRAAASKPLYQRAYEEGAGGIITPEIERMTGSPAFAEAMRKAATSGQDRAILEGFGAFNPRVTVTQDGRVVFNRTKQGGSPLYPDLQFWDYVKRNLDDMAGAAARAGRNEEASVARSLAAKLRSELDQAVPSYKAARDAYAGPSAIMESLEEGQKVFSRTITPNQLRANLAKMSEAEREAYIQGARAQIADMMGTARNDALKVRSEFQKGYNKEKLEILVGREQAKRLIDSLEAETAFTRTRDIVTGNSETAARSAAMREIGGAPSSTFGVRDAYAAGGVMGALRGAALRGADKVSEALLQRRTAATNEELARLLMGRDTSVLAPAKPELSGPRRAILDALMRSSAQQLPAYIGQ